MVKKREKILHKYNKDLIVKMYITFPTIRKRKKWIRKIYKWSTVVKILTTVGAKQMQNEVFTYPTEQRFLRNKNS